MSRFNAMKQIEIDAGHRVTNHHSACKSIHGHRYKIEAHATGELITAGSSEGMVVDFGDLKKTMMSEIHSYCDHATILWIKDTLVQHFIYDDKDFIAAQVSVLNYGYYPVSFADSLIGKLYVIDCVPTAENLAKHWFDRLKPHFSEESFRLFKVKVYETPNCFAEYSE